VLQGGILLQEFRGAYEASREQAHFADDEFQDLQLRSIGEHGKQLSSLYAQVADNLSDQGRMHALWEREGSLRPGESAKECGVASPELHWDARKQLNAVLRWTGQSAKGDAARLREEAFMHAAKHQGEKDLRRRQVLSKYRV
jgi:hypothetical protein